MGGKEARNELRKTRKQGHEHRVVRVLCFFSSHRNWDSPTPLTHRRVFVLCLYRAGPRPHIPFPPDLILYVNLVAKGALKTLAPRLTVLDIPYFADAYSRTVRPIDLHNF